MTKENTYVELLNKIAEQEEIYNQRKAENEQKKAVLANLKIDNDNKKPLENENDAEWQRTRAQQVKKKEDPTAHLDHDDTCVEQ